MSNGTAVITKTVKKEWLKNTASILTQIKDTTRRRLATLKALFWKQLVQFSFVRHVCDLFNVVYLNRPASRIDYHTQDADS